MRQSNSSFEQHEWGYVWRFDNYRVYFGNKSLTKEHFDEHFSQFQLYTLNQVHGDVIVRASKENLAADAHYTSEFQHALQIKTADCLPVFVVDPLFKIIAGVHAGWKGVANEIAAKTLLNLISRGGNPKGFRVVIGPHIRKESFEVEENVWAQLMDAIPQSFSQNYKNYYIECRNNKYLVDLEGIVRSQVRDLGVPEDNIESLSMDTFRDTQWHSFRRDKEKSGRNLSFIVSAKA